MLSLRGPKHKKRKMKTKLSKRLCCFGPKVSALSLHEPCPNSIIPFALNTVFLYILWTKGTCSTGVETCCKQVLLIVKSISVFQFHIHFPFWTFYAIYTCYVKSCKTIFTPALSRSFYLVIITLYLSPS